MFGGLVCRLLVGTPGGTTGPPPLATRPPKGQRIRLGIVSGWFQDHTIFRLFLESWLAELDRDRFEIVAFHTGQSHDRETARAATLSGRFVHGLTSAAQWREAVLREEPHVLLYPEVGMDPVAARLAAQRLAPVQCVAWGHPETTGMPTMDYFLSADLMEPPGADAHYTEQLVRLPGLGLHYTPDDAPVDPLDRAPRQTDGAVRRRYSEEHPSGEGRRRLSRDLRLGRGADPGRRRGRQYQPGAR